MLKTLIVVFGVAGLACAYPQVLIPTSLSTQSGIVRNIPTTLVGLPINTIISDRDRVLLATQLQLNQLQNTRLWNGNVNNNINENRNVQDQINQEIALQQIQNRLTNQLNDQTRVETLRRQLDRDDVTRRTLQLQAALVDNYRTNTDVTTDTRLSSGTGSTTLTNEQLRAITSNGQTGLIGRL